MRLRDPDYHSLLISLDYCVWRGVVTKIDAFSDPFFQSDRYVKLWLSFVAIRKKWKIHANTCMEFSISRCRFSNRPVLYLLFLCKLNGSFQIFPRWKNRDKRFFGQKKGVCHFLFILMHIPSFKFPTFFVPKYSSETWQQIFDLREFEYFSSVNEISAFLKAKWLFLEENICNTFLYYHHIAKWSLESWPKQ